MQTLGIHPPHAHTHTHLPGAWRSPFYHHTAIFVLQSPALFHVYSSTTWSMHNATQNPTTNKTVTHASIWIFMQSLKQPTVASFPPVNLGDGRRWTIMNSTGNYTASMNGATLGHEWAFVSLWCTLKQAWKIQVNSPMRLGLKIRHGDKQTWLRHEPVPPNAPHELALMEGRPRGQRKLFVCLVAGALACSPKMSAPLFFQVIGRSLTGP